MVVRGSSALGLPSTDRRSERGRLNVGFGLVGTGGFENGLGERELELYGRGDSFRVADFRDWVSLDPTSDEGDMGGEPRSMKEAGTGLELGEGGSVNERTEEAV